MLIFHQSPQGANASGAFINHGEMPPSPVAYSRNRYNTQVEHRAIQTEMTSLQIQNMEAKSQEDLSKKDNFIQELERVRAIALKYQVYD